MEIDAGKIVPDQSQKAGKMKFLDGVDKASGNYLQSALNAIIEKFTDGDKLEPPSVGDAEKRGRGDAVTKVKKKLKSLLSKTKDQNPKAEDLLKTKFSDLPAEIRNIFFHGTKRRLTFRQGTYRYESDWKGALRTMRDRMEEPPSEKTRAALDELVAPVPCPVCEGARLQPESLAVKVNGLGIADYSTLPIDESVKKIDDIKLNPREEKIAGLVLKEIRDRLQFLTAVGLGYLTLDRASATLSGGEGQRIRLATQIGSQLRGVLYVLDEPSIGLHPRDNQKLLGTLHQLRDLGNTVLVVEHDEETIEHADYVVDLGPLAGTHGGEIVATGTPDEIEKNAESLTGRYLNGELKIDIPELRRLPNGNRIRVKGARAHNLKNIDVEFPLGLLTVVTGVSGSGKSTLVEEILYPALYRHVYTSAMDPLEHDSIDGLDLVDTG